MEPFAHYRLPAIPASVGVDFDYFNSADVGAISSFTLHRRPSQIIGVFRKGIMEPPTWTWNGNLTLTISVALDPSSHEDLYVRYMY